MQSYVLNNNCDENKHAFGQYSSGFVLKISWPPVSSVRYRPTEPQASGKTGTFCIENHSGEPILVTDPIAAIIGHFEDKPNYWLHSYDLNAFISVGWTSELQFHQYVRRTSSSDFVLSEAQYLALLDLLSGVNVAIIASDDIYFGNYSPLTLVAEHEIWYNTLLM